MISKGLIERAESLRVRIKEKETEKSFEQLVLDEETEDEFYSIYLDFIAELKEVFRSDEDYEKFLFYEDSRVCGLGNGYVLGFMEWGFYPPCSVNREDLEIMKEVEWHQDSKYYYGSSNLMVEGINPSMKK